MDSRNDPYRYDGGYGGGDGNYGGGGGDGYGGGISAHDLSHDGAILDETDMMGGDYAYHRRSQSRGSVYSHEAFGGGGGGGVGGLDGMGGMARGISGEAVAGGAGGGGVSPMMGGGGGELGRANLDSMLAGHGGMGGVGAAVGGDDGANGSVGPLPSAGMFSVNETTIATEDNTGDPSRLYALCEMALPTPEEANASTNGGNNNQLPAGGGGSGGAGAGGQGAFMTATEAARRREALEQTWEAVREWLQSHPLSDDRRLAATYQGMFSATALHVVCKLPDPPEDIVQSLIACSTDTVTWADAHGWIPLHHACANGASGDILKILIDAFPQSKVEQDRRKRTPLHFVFFRSENSRNAAAAAAAAGANGGQGGDEDEENKEEGRIGHSMPDIVTLLSDTGAAELPDENGMLPLHYACAYGTSPAVLERLVAAYPESIVARANKGRTPLHFAMVNAHRAASLDVLRFLLGVRGGDVVNMTDREGHLPLHMLANIASRLRPEQKDSQSNAIECLKLYLNAKPRATADFLTAIQALPEWLRDNAVVNPHVQEILNDKIAKCFPTSILMMDGYMLLLIIVCFEFASGEHIDHKFTGSPRQEPRTTFSIAAVLFGGLYFLVRELVQMFSLLSLGTFRSWLLDSTNWLDMLLIGLVFYFAAAMAFDDDANTDLALDGITGTATTQAAAAMTENADVFPTQADKNFRDGVAFTKGVLWTSVIIFLKSTMVDFAVFVEGVFYVVQRLAAFLLALGVILLAFAQMFVIVYAQTDACPSNGEGDFPHCQFWDSFLKVYTMLMGEVGDETRYETNLVAQLLYVAFAFLVVILLSNVLIAIVTDNYGVIKNDRAAMVFWSNRLDFVAEMDAIASVRKMLPPCRFRFGGRGNVKEVMESSGNEGEGGGDIVANASPAGQESPGGGGADGNGMGGGVGVDGGTGDERSEKQRMQEAWKTVMGLFDSNLYDDIDVHVGSFEFWCYFLLRIVAVVIIPLWLACGLLTAGWLWPPQVREWLFVQRETPISRADLANQALMEIYTLRSEVKTLRTELKGEMKVDRREVMNMKTEVDTVQSEVMSDLLQVKELMSTLLVLSRQQQQQQQDGGGGGGTSLMSSHVRGPL